MAGERRLCARRLQRGVQRVLSTRRPSMCAVALTEHLATRLLRKVLVPARVQQSRRSDGRALARHSPVARRSMLLNALDQPSSAWVRARMGVPFTLRTHVSLARQRLLDIDNLHALQCAWSCA